MELAVGGVDEGRKMRRTLSDENAIRGEIVEVVLPKGKDKGDKDYSCAKSRPKQIRLKAQPVCLQVGDNNSLAVVDLTMPADVSDGLTKVSDDEELVIRVLRRYGSSEELVPVEDARKLRQALDIHADFVRIISPADEKSKLEEYTLVSDIKACYAMIGNKTKIVIHPEGFAKVFDNTRPVLRVLRLPTKPVAVVKNAKDFPNVEKDHLIVLAIYENRFTTRAVGYSFSQSSSVGRSRKMTEFYEVKISVSQCGRNGKTEVRDGVLFKQESALDCLQGIVGYWCRFQTAKTRYIVTFSLWRTETASQTSELLDEARIAVETSERKIPPRRLATRKQSHTHKQNSGEVASLPHRNPKQTSIPEESHSCVTPSMETPFPEQCHAIEETTSHPVEETAKVGFDERYFKIRKSLLLLQDDGKWDEFNLETEKFLKEFADDIDLQIAVILEQGMACCYRGELSSAEHFIKKAMGILPKASSTLVPLFKARANCYLAGIYRRDEKTLGRAQRCIESAKKYLSSTKAKFPLDQVHIAYEEGCLLLEYVRKPCVVEQGQRSFDRCMELCSRVSSEDMNDLMSKQHDLAQMKKAMLLLDCSTKSGRKDRSITEKTLIEVRQCLDRLKINIVEEMSRFAQAQYHLVRSDQYYREERFVDCNAHAQTALALSEQYHFDTEHAAAKARLEHYNKIIDCI